MNILESYFSVIKNPKLHIGCGSHVLGGWLNCDLTPLSDQIFTLDASKKFPFADNVFDFIFTEHMIEHIPYEAGLFMMKECLRVLKPGGVMRVSTPDLKFLFDIYTNPGKELHRDYIRWSIEMFSPEAISLNPAFVLNKFVRDWGHSFIYDKKTLEETMLHAGFARVEICSIGASAHAELSGLEYEGRLPPGFLNLETMTIEAMKPR